MALTLAQGLTRTEQDSQPGCFWFQTLCSRPASLRVTPHYHVKDASLSFMVLLNDNVDI